MDNEETAGLAFGRLSSEFIRVKVAPEQDAFRFATYAGTTGISKVSAGATLSSGNDVLTALITAQNKMDEDEVLPENRILYITPTLYNLAINVDTTKSKAVLDGFADFTLRSILRTARQNQRASMKRQAVLLRRQPQRI